MDEIGSGSGAWCALHRDRAAADICQRCGAFMCQECNEHGASPTCPSCRGRAALPEHAFPLTRTGWSLGELFDRAWSAFSREWLMLSVVTLVFFALWMAVYVVVMLVQAGVSVFSQEAGGVAAIVMMPLEYGVFWSLSLGTYRVYREVLLGKKADLAVLFSQFNKFGKVLLQGLLAILLVAVPLALWAGLTAAVVFAVGTEHWIPIAVVSGLLAAVPLVWLALPLYLMHPELALHDEVGPVQSLKNCFTIARGARWPLLGMSLLAGIVASAGVVLCCVGVLASMPFGQLVLTGFYLALRRGSELDPIPSAEPSPPLTQA